MLCKTHLQELPAPVRPNDSIHGKIKIFKAQKLDQLVQPLILQRRKLNSALPFSLPNIFPPLQLIFHTEAKQCFWDTILIILLFWLKFSTTGLRMKFKWLGTEHLRFLMIWILPSSKLCVLPVSWNTHTPLQPYWTNCSSWNILCGSFASNISK